MSGSSFANFDKMYEELRQAGYPDINNYKNHNEYIKALATSTRDFKDFNKIVIKWLPLIEYIVGGLLLLQASKEKYDGRLIIPIFENSSSQDRWRICAAIMNNPPMFLEEWVREIYFSKEYTYSDTGLLPLVVVKIFPRDEARNILKEGFDLHYRVAPEALGKVGRMEDIPFLKDKLLKKYEATHVTKDIEKAIQEISKREKV